MKQNEKNMIAMLSVAMLIVIGLTLIIYIRHSTPPPKPVKTVIFKSKNKLSGTKFIVQESYGKLDTVLANSNGEASYKLFYDKSIKLKSEVDNIKIITDSDYRLIKYNDIMDGDTISVSLYPNNDLSFQFKVVSESDDILDNATISSNQLKLSSEYILKNSGYTVRINKNQFPKNSIQLGDTISLDIVSPGYKERQFDVAAVMAILESEKIILASIDKEGVKEDKEEVKEDKERKTYNYYFSVSDSYDDTQIPGLSFYIKGHKGINSTEEFKGKYNLSFDTIGKDYSIVLKDPSGKYREKIFSFVLQENDIGGTKSITLSQITNFSLKVRNDKGDDLSNAMVIINDKKIKTTNDRGEFFHVLSLTKDPIKLLISKKGYTHAIEEITLLSSSNSHISYLTPITKGFKIIDSVSGDIVLGLKVDSNTILKYFFEDGVYWIQFDQFGNNTFKLTDHSGMYQDSEYNVEIQENNIEIISENKIHRVTHIIIKVIDDSENPVIDVAVKNKLGRGLGLTSYTGVLRKTIVYADSYYTYNIKHPKYFEIDTTVLITPGENIIEQTLRKFPEMILTIQNQHTNEAITDLSLKINGKDYFTDNKGTITIQPSILNEEYDFQYNDGDSKYYKYNSTIIYKPQDRKSSIILSPVAYLKIKTFYGDGVTPMGGVNLFYKNERLDVKNNQKEFSLKIPSLNREYEITAGKDEYETKQIKVSPSDLYTEVKFVLDQLAATLLIVNVFDNPINDVTVRYAGKTSKVDRYGKVEIIPKKLNSPINIELISPEKIYKDTSITYNFTKNRDIKKIILLTIPFDLEVTIKDYFGIPCNGAITISPPPNPTKGAEYTLVDGKVNINIYESKDYWLIYDVSFYRGDKQHFVTNKSKIEVQLSKKKMYLRETIRGATVKAETKNKELLTITNMDDSNSLFSLKGDGIDALELDSFGDYQFCYEPPGFNVPICEVRTVNSPHQIFYFTVDDNYEKGVIAEENGDGEKACSYYRKVPVGSPNYCDAIEKCIKINNNNMDIKAVENDIWKYIGAMNATECDENFSYYGKYIEVASQMRIAFDTESENLDSLNILWGGGNETKIRKAYNRFRDLCPIMSSGCEEQETKVKIIILRGIADVMSYTKRVFDNTLDIDITKSCKNLNENLYNSHQYYSRDLNVNQWNSEKRQIEGAHLD